MIGEQSGNVELLDSGEFIQVLQISAMACALLIPSGER
jgi:hypothetical protein